MSIEIEHLKKMEKFIEQFDGLNSTNGEYHNIRNIVKSYKGSYSKLCENRDDLLKLLSLDDFDYQEADNKEEEYPAAIRNGHLLLAATTGAAALTVSFITIGYLIGGGTPDLWAPAVYGIGLGTGAIPSTLASVLSDRVAKKNFIQRAEADKLSKLEKRIIKRYNDRKAAISEVSMNINNNLEQLFSGEYKLSSQVQKGKKVVTEWDEGIEYLPLPTKIKLKRILSSIENEAEHANKLKNNLQVEVDKIRNKPQNPVQEETKSVDEQIDEIVTKEEVTPSQKVEVNKELPTEEKQTKEKVAQVEKKEEPEKKKVAIYGANGEVINRR